MYLEQGIHVNNAIKNAREDGKETVTVRYKNQQKQPFLFPACSYQLTNSYKLHTTIYKRLMLNRNAFENWTSKGN